jgi:hypothetical protein
VGAVSAPPLSGDFRSPAHLGGAPTLLRLDSPDPLPGEDVMAQVEELLLLTCLGGFAAGFTYAVTLLFH